MPNLVRGFTVVETLVAITVLAIAIAGPLSIAFQGLRSAELAKDQITASYLAQEGIEFIRAKRDENYLNGNPVTWASLFNTCNVAVDPDGCWVDMSEIPATWGSCGNAACTAIGENPVDYQSSTGLYGHSLSSSVDSKYTRIIKMTGRDIDGDPGIVDEYLISSTVTWKTGSIDRSITVEETITEWQENI